MKVFKIILGAVLLVASFVTLSELSVDREQGTGLTGSTTGFLLIGGFGVWLIYIGSMPDKKNK